MALFSFLRNAFEQERGRVISAPPVFVRTPVTPPPHDPALRLFAFAFVSALTSTNDISFKDAWCRLYHLPIHSVALLDSPAGWVALANLIGLSPRVTVH